MAANPSGVSDLVMTQAELPPGVEAPTSPALRNELTAGGKGENSPAELLREVRQLADRVGGIERLRELIDEVAKLSH